VVAVSLDIRQPTEISDANYVVMPLCHTGLWKPGLNELKRAEITLSLLIFFLTLPSLFEQQGFLTGLGKVQ
jgi:hypothetical protein